MRFLDVIVCFSIAISAISAAAADSMQGCGGFVEASRSLIKSRKQSDPKLDYSHLTVELRTVDGLVKDRTQCAPNGYYFIPVYDKGSFVIKIKGPEGWSWDPDNVPVVIDQNGCNGNADINFRFTGFTLSGRVVGAVGGESCLSKEGGPSNVKVELLSLTDDVISSVFTLSVGGHSFTNIIPDLECSLLHFNSSSSSNSYHLMNDERRDPNYFCTFHFMIVFYRVPFFTGYV